jgi:arylsulfatase A-like enzyme
MKSAMKRCSTLVALVAGLVLVAGPASAQSPAKKPNIVILWGDDIGWFNVSAYNHGLMGYKTPNTGQYGKNHLGDQDDHLPTAHGFDEFFGREYRAAGQEADGDGGRGVQRHLRP